MIERLDVQPNAPSELPFLPAVDVSAAFSEIPFLAEVIITAARNRLRSQPLAARAE